MYVDDLFLTNSEKLIVGCKVYTIAKFEMKDIGLMHDILGLDVSQIPREIFHGQGKYAVEILKIFRMEDCKTMAMPMITNLKEITCSYSNMVDPPLYM